MSTKKILKNNSGDTLQILRRELADQESYDIPKYFWDELSDKEDIKSLVSSGDIIVNNGEEDLDSVVGLEHIISGVKRVTDQAMIVPGIGINNPELVVINQASYGFRAEIGDKGYFTLHIDNIVGDSLYVGITYIIDNDQSDRWASFNLSLLSTNCEDGKDLRYADSTVKYGPLEVNTEPFKVKRTMVEVPTNLWQNNENTLFFGIERLDVSLDGKVNPENDPIVVKVCTSYFTRVR